MGSTWNNPAVRLVPVLAAAILLCAAGCIPAEPQEPVQASSAEKVRLMTYNIEWLSDRSNPGRISNLKAIVEEIDPDVIAMQEVSSRKAVEQFLGSDWSIAILDSPEEAQELALAVKAPFSSALRAGRWPSPHLA